MRGMEGPPGAETTIDGRRYLYFAGTGYFGLHGHPEVIKAGVEAFRRYGTHGATSRAGFGNNPVLHLVEKRLKEFFAAEEAVYFGSGYLSSLVLVQGLKGRFDAVFVDEGAHFCVHDAAQASGCPVLTFRHCDIEDLKRQVRRRLKPRQRPLLLTDGVFPTFGRIAPLADYAGILSPYNGLLGVDDAHGAGVLGRNGRGTAEYFGLASKNLYQAGTLSKAFGGHGGFVLADRKTVERVRTASGAFIGSTPTATPVAAASAKGIEILSRHPEMRRRLQENVAALKAGLKKIGVPVEDTPVPIVAWSLRSEKAMRDVQRQLMRRGIAVAFLKYAGAPRSGVLRLTVFSTHTREQIDRLLCALGEVL